MDVPDANINIMVSDCTVRRKELCCWFEYFIKGLSGSSISFLMSAGREKTLLFVRSCEKERYIKRRIGFVSFHCLNAFLWQNDES